MKIGIIVHSQTGHTLSVAEKILEKLTSRGHLVMIEKLTVLGEAKPGMKEIAFGTLPDLRKYDAFIFASPVEAFSLSAAMMGYLGQIPSLNSKNAACFVTQHFPYPWMGGNRSAKQMKHILVKKEATIVGTGVINWVNATKREQQISELANRFESLF